MTAVAAVVAKAGHAPERVVNDYGEDLLVQTSHAGRMDASRLWFQVKGTEQVDKLRLKRGGFRISVDLDHELRWSRSADLVVLVLWDVAENVGWYAFPGTQIDPRERLTLGQRTRSIHFGEENRLTPAAVNHLAWDSRLDHYRLLLLSARDSETVIGPDEELPSRRSKRRILITLDFLLSIGLLERGHLANEESFCPPDRTYDIFREYFEDEEILEEDGLKPAAYAALIRTVLRGMAAIDETVGVPVTVMEDSIDTLFVVMRLDEAISAVENRE